MDQSKKDEAILTALIHKLNTLQLPRAKRMLERLENGEKLRDGDIGSLKREYNESMKDWGLIERNPKYMDIALSYVHLYTSIIEKAVANERST
jgi:hypothetical protein